jgi:hypothetical protein
VSPEERLKQAVDSATAIIFLNQLWIKRLAEILDDNELLTGATADLVASAQAENREAFSKINQLGKAETKA